jgi:hypothetical protein
LFPFKTSFEKYFPFLSVIIQKKAEIHPKEISMTKMSPAVVLATLLFFGASVFAEETTAPASQTNGVTTGNQSSKQKAYRIKHTRHDYKSKKGNNIKNSKI